MMIKTPTNQKDLSHIEPPQGTDLKLGSGELPKRWNAGRTWRTFAQQAGGLCSSQEHEGAPKGMAGIEATVRRLRPSLCHFSHGSCTLCSESKGTLLSKISLASGVLFSLWEPPPFTPTSGWTEMCCSGHRCVSPGPSSTVLYLVVGKTVGPLC